MPNLRNQSLVRLLSVAAISSTMLLSASVVPAVAPVLAEEPANETTQASPADTSAIPESNPYADLTQCVAGAWDFAAEAGHKLPWFAGNAMDWRQGAIEHGLKVVDTIDPSVANAVAVWQPGVGGASGVGHVGWVEKVDGDRFLVKDRNWIPATDDERWVTWQEGISFIVCDNPQPTPPADQAQPQTGAPANPAPSDQAPPADQPQDEAPAAHPAPADQAPATDQPQGQPAAPANPAPADRAPAKPGVDMAALLRAAGFARPFTVQQWTPNRPFSDIAKGPWAGVDLNASPFQPEPGLPLAGWPAFHMPISLNAAHA